MTEVKKIDFTKESLLLCYQAEKDLRSIGITADGYDVASAIFFPMFKREDSDETP